MESEEKFNNCNFDGATRVGVVSPADYTVTQFPAYFSCSLENHCQNGLKLKVTESKSFTKYDILMYYMIEIILNNTVLIIY